MNVTMYDKLLKLPLFQGLSQKDLTEIIEKIKVEFRTYGRNKFIVKQGMSCSNLIYVMDGSVEVSTTDSLNRFCIREHLGSYQIIEPYSLFGLKSAYTSSYKACETTRILIIPKKYILSVLCKYEIFNLNYLNILSNRAQAVQLKIWNSQPETTLERIIDFIAIRCTYPYGAKEVSVKMKDLATIINDTRINISRTLNELSDKNLIALRRKIIIINDFQQLVLFSEQEKDKLKETNKIPNKESE